MQRPRPYIGIASFIVAVIVVGMGGIIVQTILIRELLILFSGNEFSLGVIIGSWIIWEAIGALAGGRIARNGHDTANRVVWMLLVFAVLFPPGIYIIRVFKLLIGTAPEVGIGIVSIFCSSLIVLLPSGFLHGLLFPLVAAVYSNMTANRAESVGKIYFYEMTGTILGGIAVSYLFIPYLSSFQVAILFVLITAGSCLFFLFPVDNGKKKPAFAVAALLAVISVVFLSGGGATWMHNASIKRQWQGKNLVFYGNSPYQNITVTKDNGQYTFFSDGIPAVTVPVPDIFFVEEFVHFTMLSHPHPENILILGGGVGGVIREILKYPAVRKVDYVEIDPMFLQTIKRFSTPLTAKELNNPLVHLHYTDGRLFVKDTGERYDVILMGIRSPRTLQANRFFTTEFFTRIRGILKDGGILSFTMPGSLTYYNDELKDLNVCILSTLRAVFPYTFLIPGDFNLYLGSVSSGVESVTPAVLAERLTANGIRSGLISLPHLTYRLDRSKARWFAAVTGDAKKTLNTDLAPRGVFFDVAYCNSLFTPSLKPFFQWANGIRTGPVILLVLIVSACCCVLGKRFRGIGIPYAIGTTGFAAMVLELILLFGFQISYGYIFYEVGILITMFMVGLAAGSLLATAYLRTGENPFAVFVATEAALAVFSLAVCGLFATFSGLFSAGHTLVRLIFFSLLFLTGVMTGFEFPVANALYLMKRQANTGCGEGMVGESVGVLYGVDLIGGWIGGVSGGIILLPILGLLDGCLLLAVLKAGSLLVLLTFRKR